MRQVKNSIFESKYTGILVKINDLILIITQIKLHINFIDTYIGTAKYQSSVLLF